MKWKTAERTESNSSTSKAPPGHGGRYSKRGDVVETGVFRPLSEYGDVTVSGVFRPLSEEGFPSANRAAMPSSTTKIYIGPPEKFSTRITTGEPVGRNKISTSSGKIVVAGNRDTGSKIVVSGGRDSVVSVGKRELSSKSNGIKKSDSQSVAKRGRDMCEPSGESAQLTYRSSSSVSEVVAGGSSSYAKLESSSSSTSSGDSPQQGMHPEARDTGQQRGASPLSRASSPGSSSGSSYNLSSTTDTTQDSRVLRVTPMGSTTGLLPNSTVNSHSKIKVDGGCMPGLSAFLSILSLAANLGNVLRLPRVVFLSGDGTFLVIYICISLIFGIPLVFLEIGLGQFCQEGTTKLWRAVPLFKGIGYVKVLASGLVSVYYPVLMGLSLFYMVWCAKGPMPFEECALDFTKINGEACLKETFLKSVNVDAMWFGVSVAFIFLLWALFMLCIFKSDNSYKASTYFIFTPIIVGLVALLVQSLLYDTSAYGLQRLVTFHWEKLLNLNLWYSAIVQMFFSTQLGFGNIVTCAGRLYSKNNALWTAVFYVICNLVIGVLAVCLMYQWMGLHDLSSMNISIPEALVYTITYDAAAETDLHRLWPSLMFLVIICTGFAAMLAALYTILVAISLEINKKCSWWVVAGCICIIGFLAGILCIIPENMEIVHILDHYVVGRIVIASTALELIAFAWIYGSNTLYNDFEFVLGRQLNPIWKFIWLITPFLLMLVEIWSMVSLPRTGLDLSGRPSDPVWVYTTGWLLYLLAWVIIISAAIHQIHAQVDYNLSQKFLSTLKPSRNWGPVDTIYRHWWVQWRVTCTKTGQRDFTFKRRGTKDYTSSVQKYNTTDAIGTYRQTPSSTNGTLQHNRAKDKGPFTIQTNGNLPEHVCWRGTLHRHDGT